VSDAVEWWTRQLACRVGLPPEEITVLETELGDFCRRRDVEPEELIEHWRRYPELSVRRNPLSHDAPQRAVESFLIHNGVNVFGEIVCVPGRAEDLAEQGPQFVAQIP
jgi:hypothetical protein